MKRIFLVAALLAITTTAADAGPLRCLAARMRTHSGPVVNAVRHNVAAQPMRTVAGRVIELPAKFVESRTLATMFSPKTCPNCK